MTSPLWAILSWYSPLYVLCPWPPAAAPPLPSLLSDALSMLPLLSISADYIAIATATETAVSGSGRGADVASDASNLAVVAASRGKVLGMVCGVCHCFEEAPAAPARSGGSRSSSSSRSQLEQQQQAVNRLFKDIMAHPALAAGALDDLAGFCKCLYDKQCSSRQQQQQSSSRGQRNRKKAISAVNGSFAELGVPPDHNGMGGQRRRLLTRASACVWEGCLSSLTSNAIRPAILLDFLLMYNLTGAINVSKFNEVIRSDLVGERTLPSFGGVTADRRLQLVLQAAALLGGVEGAEAQLLQLLELLSQLCWSASDAEARAFLDSRGPLLVKVLVLTARRFEDAASEGRGEEGSALTLQGFKVVEKILNDLVGQRGDRLGK